MDVDKNDAPEKSVAEPGYSLTPGEQAVFHQLNIVSLQAKCQVHDLHVQLEAAQARVSEAQQAFTGALTFLANSKGMQSAKLTPDFTRVVPA